jgi:histidinol-phosphate aminotransferase
MPFTSAQERDLIQRGFSRRSFARMATLLTAGASLPFYNEFALAQRATGRAPMSAGVVKLDSNENPLGPCPEALEALFKAARDGGRYMFGLSSEMAATLAEGEGLSQNYVQAYAGSSGPLHQAVLAFTSPTRAYVMADPGYESGGQAASFVGAETIRVPLTKDYAHDVKAMVAAAPKAGLFYICNPNNPTGTMTPRADIEWLLANKPAGSIVLLDEAYGHLSGLPMLADLVKADKDIVILRTFSKLYGMAGIRAGAVIGRPDLLAKVRPYSANFLPTTAMAAATASLQVKTLIVERRKITKDTRDDVFAFFDKHNFRYIPSLSNKFMVDCGKPGRIVSSALRADNIVVGRSWSALPNHIRVTVGTQAEMDQFKAAFLKAMSST